MSAANTEVARALTTVRQRIRNAELDAGRVPGSVQLLAVSKTKPLASILAALHAGQHDFGENYLDEAVEKIQALEARQACRDTEPDKAIDTHGIRWHFIGAIQSNKTASIARHFDWVHSVDRVKIARRLSAQRSAERAPLNILLQVNIDREPQKAGVDPGQLGDLAAEIAALPNLVLRGLMAIPAPTESAEAQHVPLQRMHACFVDLQGQYPDIDTLSMGMSGDLEAAVAEGATLVRIGTAVFGARR